MAIIYGYPIGTPTAKDNLLGTQVNPVTEENKTVQFPIGTVGTLLTQGYIESTIIITRAQLLALQTTNVQLLAAPGLNKYIKVLEVSGFLDYTAPAYTAAASIILSINAVQQSRFPDTFLESSADTVYSGQSFEAIIAANTALLLTTAGAVANAGGSSLEIKIRYQVLDTSAF